MSSPTPIGLWNIPMLSASLGLRKLRSIPPRTCITLAREGKLISVARNYRKNKQLTTPVQMPIVRGRMRPQVSRKPFEAKLSQLQDELNDLVQFAAEGFDISKLEAEMTGQIKRLEQLLGEI